MVVIVPEDVLAPNGARPPAGTMIGSGDGFLPDSTKALPEPLLAYHQRGVVWFSHENTFVGNAHDITL